MNYNIIEHIHKYAAWAASRGASVNGCRFKVEQGNGILTNLGISELILSPDKLPENQEDFDTWHRGLRNQVIQIAHELYNINFTHGVAAKLINLYLKTIYLSDYHKNTKLRFLHPPIDRMILKNMVRDNFNNDRKYWRIIMNRPWSRLSSDEYEELINRIRNALAGQPLWTIETYWPGYQ